MDPDGNENKVAIVGYDNRWGVRKTFYEAAKQSGNRIVSSGIIFPIKGIGNYGAVKSGKEAISVLKKSGSKNNPITDIFFSTHGAPYAIDFWNSGNNIYISEESMKSLSSNFTPGNEAAYISDIVSLVNEGIIASDVNIVLGGCLNGARPSNVPVNTEDATARAWASRGMENFAKALSKALPNATITANRTQVDASKGLNSPVVYKNGEEVR